ncbi:MAG: hypothetical protein IPK16_29715 [Anaerolineales bacterium]|nr:hypothetical protein [Anaerolineales bacterium]
MKARRSRPAPSSRPTRRWMRYIDNAIAAGSYNLDKLWTHDPAKADEILQAKGYAKGDDGYYAKDGKQLTLDIATNEAFIEKQRIAAVLVEELQRIGINASTQRSRCHLAGQLPDGQLRIPDGLADLRFGQRTLGIPQHLQHRVAQAGRRTHR